MALITVNAVVDVPVHFVVLEIVRVVVAMASGALEDRVVTTINVAGGALAVCVAMIGWESCVLRVIECGSCPCARGVAGRALPGREENGILPRRVRRVRGAVVIALVAGNASVAG